MQIYEELEQGSLEWHDARAGRATSSEFSKILTPKGRISAQAEGYANQCVSEILLQRATDILDSNYWMERGKILENDAAEFYSLTYSKELKKIGFITTDCGFFGASPDRLVDDEGLLEIKCPAPKTHIGYLTNKQVDKDYYPQLQGQMYICERKWVDIISYHPELPPSVIRVKRDEEYIKKLSEELQKFKDLMKHKLQTLVMDGHLTAEDLAERGMT